LTENSQQIYFIVVFNGKARIRMSYLFPYASVGTQLPVQPLVSVQNPQHVLNGKERDNTWLQLPVCLNLTKKPEERIECPQDAKCRANYGEDQFTTLEC